MPKRFRRKVTEPAAAKIARYDGRPIAQASRRVDKTAGRAVTEAFQGERREGKKEDPPLHASRRNLIPDADATMPIGLSIVARLKC